MDKEIPPLWEHQREVIARAKYPDCFALLMEMGTGKTRSVIEIVKDKVQQNKGKPYNVLVICPPVLILQWKREFERFTDIDKGLIIAMNGTGNDKANEVRLVNTSVKLDKHRRFVVITNYESLFNVVLFEFFKRFTEVLIVDESTRCKNHAARRTKACIKLGDIAKYRYILTGTPILNSQLDIFSQFRILDKGAAFGKDFFHFRAMYFQDKNSSWKGGKGYFPDFQPKPDTNQRIQDKIRPLSYRITKAECMDLPALVREEIFVELSQSQRKQYDSMKNHLIAFLQDDKVDRACVAELALTKCIRLQQIVSGFMKFDDDSEKSFLEFPKLIALKDLLTDIAPVHKVIVWAIYKRNYSDIKAACTELGFQTAELHGGISDKDAEVKRFMTDPTCRVMIASPAAGGVGLNLTCASYCIFYSRGFSLEADLQAEARNHRGGSTEALQYMGENIKVTRIDLLIKDSIDELIVLAIKNKLSTSEAILGMLREKLK